MTQAEGHVFICKAKDEIMAGQLGKMYHISSKQYVGEELQIRFISETQPDLDCVPCAPTLEDAYIFLNIFSQLK